eukprot:5888561-Amphidinium_carterae.1
MVASPAHKRNTPLAQQLASMLSKRCLIRAHGAHSAPRTPATNALPSACASLSLVCCRHVRHVQTLNLYH